MTARVDARIFPRSGTARPARVEVMPVIPTPTVVGTSPGVGVSPSTSLFPSTTLHPSGG